MTRRLLPVLLAVLPCTAVAQPIVDHHQHLFSPALASLLKLKPITAADLVQHLDEAGITRAVVLSSGYIFTHPSRKAGDQ